MRRSDCYKKGKWAFTMSMGDYAGPVMLQMNGGTYTDEATGAPMAMGPGDMMTAVLR